jgi:hypothetical protein
MTIFPAYWTEFARSHRLIGASTLLTESEDLSGVGADLQFLTEAQAAEELTGCWPGIGVAPDGYVPVASCSSGSGDYYYINRNDGQDGALYRVYHDAVGPDGYDPETAVARVLDSYVAVLSHIER